MAGIKFNCLVYVFCLNILWANGRILPSPYHPLLPHPTTVFPDELKANQTPLEKIVGLEEFAGTQPDKYKEDLHGDNTFFGPDDRCAILVVSNQGQTNVQQSILRKYRYNQDGDLIPGSVQYFIKFPQGNEGTALLVPLKDKAFSPSGGFVRYYKEVPPIPQSWKR